MTSRPVDAGWPTTATAKAMLRQLDADRERSGYWRSRWAEDHSDQAIEAWLRSLLDWLETAGPVDGPPSAGPLEGRSLDEIRRLCDEATPGPWFVASREGDDEGWWIWADPGEPFSVDPFTVALLAYDGPDGGQASHDEREQADAEFIAAARDLVPSLLAEVEAAHRFERSVAVEREALLAEVAMCRRIRDEMQDVAGAAVAAKASAYVDLEAARAERDSLRGVVQAVEALRELSAKALPGPWGWRHFGDDHDNLCRIVVYPPAVETWDVVAEDMQPENAEFIAAAVNAVRAALAAAADAPQPDLAGAVCLGRPDQDGRDLGSGRDGQRPDEPNTALASFTQPSPAQLAPGPSPAVLPQPGTEKQR